MTRSTDRPVNASRSRFRPKYSPIQSFIGAGGEGHQEIQVATGGIELPDRGRADQLQASYLVSDTQFPQLREMLRDDRIHVDESCSISSGAERFAPGPETPSYQACATPGGKPIFPSVRKYSMSGITVSPLTCNPYRHRQALTESFLKKGNQATWFPPSASLEFGPGNGRHSALEWPEFGIPGRE